MPFDNENPLTPVAAFAAGQPIMMAAASEAEAHDAARGARAMFQRTLASWASDMLLLQRRGLHEPTWDNGASSTRLRKAA